MTEQRFTMDNPNDWGFPITDNVTGKVYSCDSNILMKDLCNVVNGIVDENERLKQFKEKVFVLLDEKIKHYEHKPISVPVGQPMSVNFDADVDRLARLSELQDLKETLKELQE